MIGQKVLAPRARFIRQGQRAGTDACQLPVGCRVYTRATIGPVAVSPNTTFQAVVQMVFKRWPSGLCARKGVHKNRAAAAGGAARRPRTKSQATLATLAVESSGGRPRLGEWWRRGKCHWELVMVATRLGRRALTRCERVEGHRERWEDVVARRALIVARHRPETIGRTSRTDGACGTAADKV